MSGEKGTVSRQKENHTLRDRGEQKKSSQEGKKPVKKEIQLGNEIVLYTNYI